MLRRGWFATLAAMAKPLRKGKRVRSAEVVEPDDEAGPASAASSYRDDRAAMRAALEASRRGHADLARTVEELRAELQSSESTVGALRVRVAELDKPMSADARPPLKVQYDGLRRERDELQREVVRLRTEVADRPQRDAEEKARLSERAESLERELAARMDECAELVERAKGEAAAVAKVEAERKRLAGEVETLGREVAAMRRTEAERNRLVSEVEQLTREREALSRVEAERDRLVREVERLARARDARGGTSTVERLHPMSRPSPKQHGELGPLDAKIPVWKVVAFFVVFIAVIAIGVMCR